MPPTLRPSSGGPLKRSAPPEDVANPSDRKRTVTESTLKSQTAKTARDRVLEFFSDGRYHSAHELEHLDQLKPGDWVVAVRELIQFGYAFRRRSNSLIIRKRTISEKAQDLADLLAKIDATVAEDINPVIAHERMAADIKARQAPESRRASTVESPPDDEEPGEEPFPEFDVTSDVSDIEESDRIVVSVDPRGFVLSGKLLLTSTQAILAKKRSGKTYLAMVMAEQLLKLGLPFVVVDPTGVWGGLRTLASGAPSPYDVLALGGRRGVRPLTPDMGSAVASLIVEAWPRPVILDLSSMDPVDQHRFVHDLCTTIYTINTRPIHFFFDEADEWAPQTPESSYRYQRRCLSAVDRFIRRGGAKGLGGTLITQRPAVLNKNVLSQVGRLVVLNLVSPHDIDAVDDWMRKVVTNLALRTACLTSLPSLRQGEGYSITLGASGPSPLVKFMTRPKETYDSSRTPTMDERDFPVPEVGEPSSGLMEIVARVLDAKEEPEEEPEVVDGEASAED